MMSQWFLIDRDGRRPVRQTPPDYFSRFNAVSSDEWPSFSQLVLDASLNHVVRALQTVAVVHDFQLEDVTQHPERWDGALLVVKNGATLILTETDADADFAFIHEEVSAHIAGLLACNAALFGYEEACGTVFLSVWDTGAIELSWCDSTLPGPSFARVFHRNGTCTEEDPRTFALRAMDMPDTSPLLDRYAFVTSMVQSFGLDELTPDLDDFPVLAAFKVLGPS